MREDRAEKRAITYLNHKHNRKMNDQIRIEFIREDELNCFLKDIQINTGMKKNYEQNSSISK